MKVGKQKFFALTQFGPVGTAHLGYVEAQTPEEAGDRVGMALVEKFFEEDGRLSQVHLRDEESSSFVLTEIPGINPGEPGAVFVLKRRTGTQWLAAQYLRADDIADAAGKLQMTMCGNPHLNRLSGGHCAILKGRLGRRTYSLEELRPYGVQHLFVKEEFAITPIGAVI